MDDATAKYAAQMRAKEPETPPGPSIFEPPANVPQYSPLGSALALWIIGGVGIVGGATLMFFGMDEKGYLTIGAASIVSGVIMVGLGTIVDLLGKIEFRGRK